MVLLSSSDLPPNDLPLREQLDPLLDSIREDIFVELDAPTDFLAFRTMVPSCQRHIKKSWVLLMVNWLLTNF